MAKGRLDAATLDVLVLGTDDSGDIDAWRWLIEDADAGRAWRDAVVRRRRIDDLATLILGRPWLADAWLLVRRLRGPLLESSGLAARAVPDVANATLSADSSPAVAPAWGEAECLTVAVGSRVELPVLAGCQRWYSVAGRSGALTEDAWILEPNEAPVLIVVTEGTVESSLDTALVAAKRAAAVVIVEP